MQQTWDKYYDITQRELRNRFLGEYTRQKSAERAWGPWASWLSTGRQTGRRGPAPFVTVPVYKGNAKSNLEYGQTKTFLILDNTGFSDTQYLWTLGSGEVCSPFPEQGKHWSHGELRVALVPLEVGAVLADSLSGQRTVSVRVGYGNGPGKGCEISSSRLSCSQSPPSTFFFAFPTVFVSYK